jgi:hypothetical protein
MSIVTLSFESEEAAESLRSIVAKIKANDPSHKVPRLAIAALSKAMVVQCKGCDIDIVKQLDHNATNESMWANHP